MSDIVVPVLIAIGVFFLVLAVWPHDNSRLLNAADQTKTRAVNVICHGRGVAEDIEGQNRVLYACDDGRHGYLGYR